METHAYFKSIFDSEFEKKCKKFNPLATYYPAQENVIAIGDIHGDMNLAINFLKKGKVIKELDIDFFNDKKIEEHKYKLKITNFDLDHETNTSNFDNNKNEIELVYRYYKVYDRENITFCVKVIQEDNNPNIIKGLGPERWFTWTGKNTYVVQVGDQVDRCRPYNGFECDNQKATIKDEDSDLEIMLFYDSLDRIAMYHRGRVFSLLGNHEIMNVVGDMRYVSNKGGRDFSPEPKDYISGIHIRKDKFDTVIAKKMSCTRSTVLIIGSFIFVHGGIAERLASEYRLLDINAIVRQFLNKTIKHNKSIGDLLNSSKTSPLWYRLMAYIKTDDGDKQHPNCKNIFKPTMAKINETNNPIIQLKGMVIGHTPQFITEGKGITTACGNGIIRVDVGASSAFDIVSKDVLRQNPSFDLNKARVSQVAHIHTGRDGISTVKILI